MRRHYFIKEGSPVWINVPGTPFTLPGETTKYERLPGMVDWAPRDMVTRVGKGLDKEISPTVLAEQEAERGLPGTLGKGAVGGTTAGLLAAKLLGGDKFLPSIPKMLQSGVTPDMVKRFKSLPRSIKGLPLAGAGVGMLAGLGTWNARKGQRREQAQGVAKGLLTEQILQQHDLNRASLGALQGLPRDSSTEQTPVVATLGNKGL